MLGILHRFMNRHGYKLQTTLHRKNGLTPMSPPTSP